MFDCFNKTLKQEEDGHNENGRYIKKHGYLNILNNANFFFFFI